MKKQIFFALILFALLVCTVSFASESFTGEGIARKASQVDSIPKVTYAAKPNLYLNPKIGARGSELFEDVSEGKVVLRFVVTRDGEVRDPEVVSSAPAKIFDEYALKTIMDYHFKPAMKDRKPVDFIVSLPIEFDLSNKKSSYAAYKARVNGRNFYKAGELEKAIQAYSEAIGMDKGFSGYYSDRGQTYIEMGKLKEALADMNTAIKLTPDESSYYRLRSDAYSKLNDTKNMCIDLKKACELGECNDFDSAKEQGRCKL